MKKLAALDIGTSTIVAAKFDDQGLIKFTKSRDCFFDIERTASVQATLKRLAINYIESEADNRIYLVGDNALAVANMFGKEVRRPMKDGVISGAEAGAIPMIKEIIGLTLTQAGVDKDYAIRYVVPASPLNKDFDAEYHKAVVDSVLRQLGYTDISAVNEGMAVVYSELEQDNFSGLAWSCLLPSTKIYTKRGIIAVKDVRVGDEVITHRGRWRPVTAVPVKHFTGIATKIQVTGFSNNVNEYGFVDNHELYVYRNGQWQWIGCEQTEVGDVVGEPIIGEDKDQSAPTMTICERTTCSDTYTKKHITISADVQRLIGYFLGDGSLTERQCGIQFDFHKNEIDYVNDVIKILLKNFNKECTVYDKGENGLRVKCYSKGLATYFSNHFYNENEEKSYPWSLERLSKSDCINLLIGLIRSDGHVTNDMIGFTNTSTPLIILVKQLFSRCGIAAGVSYREPRSHEYNGAMITGTKLDWQVYSGSKLAFESLRSLIENVTCDNSYLCERLFVHNGFCCGKVQNIQHEEYSGQVYDLTVEEDHSFSGPQLTIHNCGAGMHNIALSQLGLCAYAAAFCGSGDQIDEKVSRTTKNMTASKITAIKEKGINIFQPTDNIQSAIAVYYRAMITNILTQVLDAISQLDNITLEDNLNIAVAGGTSLVDGMPELFKEVLDKIAPNYRFNYNKIIFAQSPQEAIAKGALRSLEIEHS